MVFDFGGGTLDVTIINIDDGMVDILATRGDSHLGGTDIDRCIYHWAVEQFKEQHGVDLVGQNTSLEQKLYERCE